MVEMNALKFKSNIVHTYIDGRLFEIMWIHIGAHINKLSNRIAFTTTNNCNYQIYIN